MKWNERIVRVEIRDGEGKVTECPKDVTVLIVNHDKQKNDVDLGTSSEIDSWDEHLYSCHGCEVCMGE